MVPGPKDFEGLDLAGRIWFKGVDENPSQEPRTEWLGGQGAFIPPLENRLVQLVLVKPVNNNQMIETFRDAPGLRVGLPGQLLGGKPLQKDPGCFGNRIHQGQ